MAEILLVNPRTRKRKSTKRRTPAQKRATAKMIAANRRRRNPSTAPATNPRRRKRRSTALAVRRPRRVSRRYARNPSRRGLGALKLNNLVAPLTDAGLMAAGGLGIHAAWAYLSPLIPPNIKTAMPGMPHVLKAATALGIGGLLLPMVTTRANANKITAGAVAVVITGFVWPQIRDYILPAGTTDGLSDYDPSLGTWLSQNDGMGEWLEGGLGTTAVGTADQYSSGLYDPTSLEY